MTLFPVAIFIPLYRACFCGKLFSSWGILPSVCNPTLTAICLCPANRPNSNSRPRGYYVIPVESVPPPRVKPAYKLDCTNIILMSAGIEPMSL